MSNPHSMSRRRLLIGAATTTAIVASPAVVRAQAETIRLGTLTPLTGAGGPYGPVMARAVAAVVEEINVAGGVLGRRLQLFSEDDQTNPEAGVRAARKLVDIDRVAAIMGTWASAVTTAVAPICWENRVFLATVSGADSITRLPHQGYLVRTQPNTTLQGRKFGEFAVEQGSRRVFFMSPQTPFAQSQLENLTAAVTRGGGEVGSMIYDDKKPSLRTEVDQALRFRPDMIVLAGYTPDTAVLLREIFRANFRGKLLAFAYSVNQQLVSSLPNEVVEGIFTLAPSPAEGSGAFARLARMIGVANPDTYVCQIYDHINMIAMAMAAGRGANGETIRANIRTVSQGGGTRVENAIDGLRALAAGQKVDYDGASGPCDFTPEGDILDCKFRYEQVKQGKIELLRIA